MNAFSRIAMLAIFICYAGNIFAQRHSLGEIQDLLNRFENLNSEEKGTAISSLQQYTEQFHTPQEKEQLKGELTGLLDLIVGKLQIALSDNGPRDLQQRALGAIMAVGDAIESADRIVLKTFESDIRRIIHSSRNAGMRKSAIYSLNVMPTIDPKTVDELVKTTLQSDPQLTRSALSALALASRNQPEIVKRLMPFFRNERAEIRRIMMRRALVLPELTPEIMDAVRLGLIDKDASVTRAAVRNFTTTSVAERARKADVQQLNMILRGTNDSMDFRISVATALQRIAVYRKDSELLQEMRDMAMDNTLPLEIRTYLIKSIGWVEGYSPGTRDFLEQLLAKDEPEVVSAAQHGIRNIDRHWKRRRR